MIAGLFNVQAMHVGFCLHLKCATELNVLQVMKDKKRMLLRCWKITLLGLTYQAFTKHEQESIILCDHVEVVQDRTNIFIYMYNLMLP